MYHSITYVFDKYPQGHIEVDDDSGDDDINDESETSMVSSSSK